MKKTNINPYYTRMKAKGYRSYLVFGPEEMLNDLKEWVRDYKLAHNLYQRPEWADKPRKLL
jgi:nitroimidazol reductase NimA-like FMN-containing flavoprotein (pyridoxamine 5'-phosphate oxidase superfamily)